MARDSRMPVLFTVGQAPFFRSGFPGRKRHGTGYECVDQPCIFPMQQAAQEKKGSGNHSLGDHEDMPRGAEAPSEGQRPQEGEDADYWRLK